MPLTPRSWLASMPPGTTPLLRAPTPEDEVERESRRLMIFMGARLVVATILLGVTLLVTLEGDRGFQAFTPRFLVGLIALIYGLTLVFAVWLLGAGRRDRIGLAQVVADLCVTSGLVYVTGGPSSAFTFLYGVAVLLAAMVIGPISARVTGAAAIVMYSSVAIGIPAGWIAPPPDQSTDAYLLPLADLAYAGLLNVLGLILVTLLAGNLSARLRAAGGRLRAAEASAATLARLNDDIVRSLSSGVISTDPDGRIRTINPVGAHLLRSDTAALTGKPLTELFEIADSNVQATIDGDGTRVFQAETHGVRPDGSRFPVGCSMNRLVDADGHTLGALVLFQDLTEITELRDAAARADRLAVLGRLSAGLAHEIRNPLGSISGSVEIVRDSNKLDADESRLLGIVLDEVERLDDLVSTMIQMGRPRGPAFRLVDLRETVDTVAEMARRGPGRIKGITLEVEVPAEEVPAWVDPDQVRQVVWNLVKNAMEASPHGRTVFVRARRGPGESAVLEVEDQGKGIDPSQKRAVYEMFHSERTHGAGIGLALVRQIVDAHGATIEIDSGARQGATFRVTFPARPASAQSA